MAPLVTKKRKQEEESDEGSKGTNKKLRKNETVIVKTGRNLKGKSSTLLNDKLCQKTTLERKSNAAAVKNVGSKKRVAVQDVGSGRHRRMASLNAQAKMHALYDSDGRSSFDELVTALEVSSGTTATGKKPKQTTKGKKTNGKPSGTTVATSPRRMASLNAQAILAASYSTDRPKLSPKSYVQQKKKPVTLEEDEDKVKNSSTTTSSVDLERKRERRISMDKMRPQIKATTRRLEEHIDLEKTLDLAKMVISGENEVLLRDKMKSDNVRRDKIEDKAEVTITGMYINPVTNTSQSFCFSRVQTYKQATSTTFTQPNIAPRPPPAHHPPPPPPPPSAYCHFGHYQPNVAPSSLTATAGASVPLDLALARHYTSAFAVPHYAPSHNSTHYARLPTGKFSSQKPRYYQPADSCLIHKPVPFHPFQNNQSSRLPQPPLANTPGSSPRASFSSHLSSYQTKSPVQEQQQQPPPPQQQQRSVQSTTHLPPPSQEMRRTGGGQGVKQGLYYGPGRAVSGDSNGNVGCQLCIHFSSSASTSSSGSSSCSSNWKSSRSLRGRPPSSVITFNGTGRSQPTKPDVGGRLSTLPTQTKTDVRTVSLFPTKKVKMEVDEIFLDLEHVPTLGKRFHSESPPVGHHPMATRRLKTSPEEVNKSVRLCNRTKIDAGAIQVKRVTKELSAEEFFKKVTASTNCVSSAQRQKQLEALRRAFNPTVAVPCLPLAPQMKRIACSASRIVANRAKVGCRDDLNGTKKTFQHPLILSSKSVTVPQHQNRLLLNSTMNVSRKPLVASSSGDGPNSVVAKASVVDAVQQIPRNRAIKNVTRYSNGWTWEGAAFQKDVYIKNDDPPVRRRCFPAMRHIEGDIVCIRDCVLLKSGPRKNDLPYVAKVAALWENPEDGEMMFSLLWYYRPEHTEFGRKPHHMEDEIFASKHRDINSVACIEDKCYVLTMNEYCRYRRRGRMMEQGVSAISTVVAGLSGGYQRQNRQPPGRVSLDMVFFCRKVYDFRQKRILKNPT